MFSTHSNSRILKFNRRSRFGNVLSPFDSDEEKDAEEHHDEDDDDDVAENDFLPNVSFCYSFLVLELTNLLLVSASVFV